MRYLLIFFFFPLFLNAQRIQYFLEPINQGYAYDRNTHTDGHLINYFVVNKPDTIYTFEQICQMIDWDKANTRVGESPDELLLSYLLYYHIQRFRIDSLRLKPEMYHSGLTEAAADQSLYVAFKNNEILTHSRSNNDIMGYLINRIIFFVGLEQTNYRWSGENLSNGGLPIETSYLKFSKMHFETWKLSPGHRRAMSRVDNKYSGTFVLLKIINGEFYANGCYVFLSATRTGR